MTEEEKKPKGRCSTCKKLMWKSKRRCIGCLKKWREGRNLNSRGKKRK